MKQIILFATLLLGVAFTAYSQPRPVERPAQPVKRAPAMASYDAKYEGGLFGFSSKRDGSLRFDDLNQRMVFFAEDGRELFSIPFASVLVIYPESKSVTSTTGQVIRNAPLPGAGLAGFLKEKRRYMIIHVDDVDADVKGVVNFKLKNTEELDSVIDTLGGKAGLQQRGDSYFRPKKAGQGS